MSPITMGRARGRVVSATELAGRSTALSLALVSGGDELDEQAKVEARRVIDRVSERLGIAGDHTVVALAGATGSGKSSLFNALVGQDVAVIGARRPTTSRPTAAVWGDTDATELLDWLDVRQRHLVETGPAAAQGSSAPGKDHAGTLDGLVLLDLPDFDSRALDHRREAERVLELVDVFVWVTDPQKYADARLHDEFVSLMARHDAVTLTVLNQTDRLGVEATKTLSKDLERLLGADGLHGVSVLATSAVSGTGLPELRQRLANAVAGSTAARTRLDGDVVAAARRLRGDVADREADVSRLGRDELDEALARAAGVPIVLDAVARDYRREAFAHTGWLFGRWTKGFSADPLRRLRLDRTGGRPPIPVDIAGSDVRAVLGRSSIPAPTASTVSAVDLATRRFVQEASEGLPLRWALAVESAVNRGEGPLADALDQAVVATPLRARRPVWWLVVNVLQWALGSLAMLGVVWYLLVWGLGLLRVPAPEVPLVLGVLPVPLLLVIGSILVGLALGLMSRWWSKVGARHRRRVIAKRLGDAIGQVADDRVRVPIDEVLHRHRQTREHLAAAGA